MIEETTFPSHIQIQTHKKCNLSCKICPHPTLGLNKDIDVISSSLFKKIVEEACHHSSFKSITFDLQNEPLIDRELADKIKMVREKRKDVFIGLTTNGVLLNKKRAKELIEVGVNKIVISLNAFNQEEFSEIVENVPFSKILSNVKDVLSLPDAAKYIKLSFGITKNNYKSSKVFIENLEKKGILYRIFAIHDRIGSVDIGGMVPAVKNKKESINICHTPLTAMTIKTNGDVILCCEDWESKLVLDNLNNKTMYEVWNSDAWKKIRNNIINNYTLPKNPCLGCQAPKKIPYPMASSFNDDVIKKLNINCISDNDIFSSNVIIKNKGSKLILKNILTSSELDVPHGCESSFSKYISASFDDPDIRNEEIDNLIKQDEVWLPILVKTDQVFSAKLFMKRKVIELDEGLFKETEKPLIIITSENGIEISLHKTNVSGNRIELGDRQYLEVVKLLEITYGFKIEEKNSSSKIIQRWV